MKNKAAKALYPRLLFPPYFAKTLMNTLKYKCWYYDTAVAANSEAAARKISLDQMPEDIRKYRI